MTHWETRSLRQALSGSVKYWGSRGDKIDIRKRTAMEELEVILRGTRLQWLGTYIEWMKQDYQHRH